MKKILLTGFEPFGEYEQNPTMEIVRNIKERTHLKKTILPVDFEATKVALEAILKEVQPDYVVSLGLNAKIGWLALEQFALNTGYDYLHHQWQSNLVENGAAAYQTHFDINYWKKQLNKLGCPTLISNHAGTYLCNFVYYHALHYRQAKRGDALFIHLPFSTEYMSEYCQQKNRAYPSLPLAQMINSIEQILDNIDARNADV